MATVKFMRCGHVPVTVYVRDSGELGSGRTWEAIGALCRKCRHFTPDAAAPRRLRGPRPWRAALPRSAMRVIFEGP